MHAAPAPQKRSQSLSFLHDTQPEVCTSPAAQYAASPVVVKQNPSSSTLVVQVLPTINPPSGAAQKPSSPATQLPNPSSCAWQNFRFFRPAQMFEQH